MQKYLLIVYVDCFLEAKFLYYQAYLIKNYLNP